MQESYSEQMLDALSGGQLEVAKKLFASALRHDDDDMLFSLAEELYGLGFLKQAKRVYLKLLDAYPDADELRTGLADVLIDEGEIDEAINYLSQITPASSAYLESLLVMADLYQTEELFEASEQKLVEAHALAPDEPVILFAMAEFYFNMRQFKDAIKYYKELLMQGVKQFSRVDLVSRIGVAYAQAGNFDNAIGYLEQIHEADMTPAIQFQLGFTYFQLKEYEKAIPALEKVVEMDNQFASVYPYLGQALVETNQLEDALRIFQQGLAVDEFNETLFKIAAETAIKLGDFALATKYYEEGLAIEPDDVSLVLGLSNLYLQAENDDDNIELLSAYVQNDEVDPQIYWNVAKSLTRVDQWELARKYWHAAADSFMDNADYLHEAFSFAKEDADRPWALELGSQYLLLQPEDYDMLDQVRALADDL
ncbi:tetratricopeptide repeat protein [Periweissella ghanensis]|uniref:Beta-barrel assembly-enhancing protease n=1 Tax=Periweissella ghanensis TaxID=467997 RepID=A0ABM8Z8B9_9LACO|nr:tetratricopeptide repeat protein [Periweissella ghanensis]MCM0600910.1 tetratricopeptide repeat protein [Periweissella ghanensis]CAH0417672.1 Beta-barrel assembly-enhancing protease [Periweissella ghanensis]